MCVRFGEEGGGSSNRTRNKFLRNILRRVGQQSNATYSSTKLVRLLKIPSGRVLMLLLLKNL